MRAIVLAVLVFCGINFAGADIAAAQSRMKIYGKSCNQLFRSCSRGCNVKLGTTDLKACSADCAAGLKSCRATLTWTSKDATITVKRIR